MVDLHVIGSFTRLVVNGHETARNSCRSEADSSSFIMGLQTVQLNIPDHAHEGFNRVLNCSVSFELTSERANLFFVQTNPSIAVVTIRVQGEVDLAQRSTSNRWQKQIPYQEEVHLENADACVLARRRAQR